MIKKTIYKILIYILSGVMFSIYISLFYLCFSNIFFTIKNWNNLEKGIIVNIWIDSNNSESYHAKMYDIKINNLIYTAKCEIETDYIIGDTILSQYKGNNNTRIIFVNGHKVGKKINGTEYLSIFFLIFFILIIIVLLKKKLNFKTKKKSNNESLIC